MKHFDAALILAFTLMTLSRAAEPASPSSAPPLAMSTPSVSYGIKEIVKLAEKGVSEDLIKAYIRNSAPAVQPSADEIIFLHQKGISAGIITAAIERGASARRLTAERPPEGTASSPAPAASAAQSPALAQPAPPVYAAPVVVQPYPVTAPAPAYYYLYNYPAVDFSIGYPFYYGYRSYYTPAWYSARSYRPVSYPVRHGNFGSHYSHSRFSVSAGFHGGTRPHSSAGWHGGGHFAGHRR